MLVSDTAERGVVPTNLLVMLWARPTANTADVRERMLVNRPIAAAPNACTTRSESTPT